MGQTYSQWRNKESLARILRELAALPAERRTNQFAARIVTLWNVRIARGADPLFTPTIGAAIRAGRPWLSFQCPACQMIGDVDVRTLDRHPGGSIESLVPHLDCPRCPKGPFVRLIGLRGAGSVGTA